MMDAWISWFFPTPGYILVLNLCRFFPPSRLFLSSPNPVCFFYSRRWDKYFPLGRLVGPACFYWTMLSCSRSGWSSVILLFIFSGSPGAGRTLNRMSSSSRPSTTHGIVLFFFCRRSNLKCFFPVALCSPVFDIVVHGSSLLILPKGRGALVGSCFAGRLFSCSPD